MSGTYTERLEKFFQDRRRMIGISHTTGPLVRHAPRAVSILANGVVVTILWADDAPARDQQPAVTNADRDPPLRTPPAMDGAAADVYDLVLGKTRGGKPVKAGDLVDAIRKGWPGFKVLCDKTQFGARLETMTGWLKRLISMGLLAKDGKGYAVGASHTRCAA